MNNVVDIKSFFGIESACIKQYGLYDDQLIFDTKGIKKGIYSIIPNIENYRIMINKLFKLKTSFIDKRIYLNNSPITDIDELNIETTLIRKLNGYRVNSKEIRAAIKMVANSNTFNPLADWIESLPETSCKYLDTWLIDVCGAIDTPINRIIGKKWLVSAVARIMSPGSYIEGSIIFYGRQAAGKTWLISNLPPEKQYYCGSQYDMSNIQKAAQTLSGKWIVELAELSSLKRSQLEETKAYLTNTEDTYTEKYANNPITVKRTQVFAGSTNDPNILTDSTGNRRFWCVNINKINQNLFLSIKDQLWKEAYNAYMDDTNWCLTDEERILLDASNKLYDQDNPLEQYMAEYLANDINQQSYTGKEAIDIAHQYDIKASPAQVSKIMIKLGFDRKHIESGTEYKRKS